MSTEPYPRTRQTGAFERRVGRALHPHLEERERVVVGASGGPDSTAALVAVTRTLGAARVVAAHFDHRLRTPEEATADREAARSVAAALGVELAQGRPRRAPANGSEEAAREVRYAWLARACRAAGASVCVTGHTLDDQAETVLLRLVRGGGAAGAAGMAPASAWPVSGRGTRGLRVVRPLLDVTRAEVERYLAALGIEARADPSNDDPAYARNRLRLQVMPELRALNPRAAQVIARFAALQRADDEALEAWAEQAWEHLRRRTGNVVTLDRRALAALPPAVASRCVRRAAAELGVRLQASQVEALLRASRRRGQRVALPGTEARTTDEALELRPLLETSGGEV